MLLVLPPSRGQTPGPDGAAHLTLAHLTDRELTRARRLVLAALAGGPHDPITSPTAPAAQVMTGVLYAAADLPGLLARRSAAATRTRDQVLIASPLLGIVRPQDPIPASRLALGQVAGIGSLATFWRDHLAPAFDPLAEGRLVVDLRSAEFAGMWRPPAGATWVSVSVAQEVDGERRSVSHFAKYWRGLLAHRLLSRRGADPSDVRSLVRATKRMIDTDAVLAVEHTPPIRPRQPHTLTLVVR